MGGRIDVESTRGQGSCFSVRLPQTEGPLERYERLHGDEAAVEASASTSEPAHRVLYIEDNLSNLRLIERVLAQRGDLAVIPAMQGRLGLELAHDLRPDLILLDLHLPDLGGDEVLRALRADPVTAGTPVIMLSADATSGQIERLLAAGADAYLTKPIDVHELIETLTEKLGPSGLSTNPMTSVGSG
jgi:CheY-like chemotaxis protein